LVILRRMCTRRYRGHTTGCTGRRWGRRGAFIVALNSALRELCGLTASASPVVISGNLKHPLDSEDALEVGTTPVPTGRPVRHVPWARSRSAWLDFRPGCLCVRVDGDLVVVVSRPDQRRERDCPRPAALEHAVARPIGQ